jgi:erythromycin esterase-like protein
VVAYLDSIDPDAAAVARTRYSCFDDVVGEGPEYGHAVQLRLTVPCEDEVVAQLVELRRRADQYLRRDGIVAEDEYLFAEQNARLVRDAERYYRTMYHGHVASWNLRDQHMSDTLATVVEHLERQVGEAKVVVWEHNSHVGDARATERTAAGERNVGQSVRVRWPDTSVLVGFTTYHGTVTAASEWGGPAERKVVRPALAGSYEEAFHRSGPDRFMVDLTHPAADVLRQPRLERAIGVIYRPETERASHYFAARLPGQFDIVVHVDRTRALEPLEKWGRHEIDLPETYPTGV